MKKQDLHKVVTRRVPLIVCICWIAGIVIGAWNYRIFNVETLLGILIIIFFSGLLGIIFGKGCVVIVFIGFIVGGITRVTLELSMVPRDIFHYLNNAEPYVFTGTVKFIKPRDTDTTDIYLQETRVLRKGITNPVLSRYPVKLRVYEKYNSCPYNLAEGNVIRFKGVLKVYKRRIWSETSMGNIYGSRINQRFYVKIKSWVSMDVIDTSANLDKKLFFYIRRKLVEGFQRNNKQFSDVSNILTAIILGDRDGLSPSIIKQFQVCGIYHVLAISGLHVGIMSWFFLILMRIGKVGVGIASMTTMGLIWLYSMLIEPRSSVTRAVIMISLYLVARARDRIPDYLNLLSIAALIILVKNPFQLFMPGFQLTFLSTLGIILFLEPINNYLSFIIIKWVRTFLGCSFAAQSMTLIIIAYHFNHVSFMGIIFSIIVLPIFSIFLVLGMLHGLIILLIPFFQPVTSELVNIVGTIFLFAVAQLSKISFLYFNVPTPSIPVMIAYYGVFYFTFSTGWKNFKSRLCIGLYAILAVILISQVVKSTRVSDGILTLTLLDTGGGESILMKFPNGRTALVDSGGTHNDNYNTGKYFLVPWLRKHNINYLDYTILTHPHPDHMNGFFEVFKTLPVGEFWFGIKEKFLPDFNKLLLLAKEKNVPSSCLGGGLSARGLFAGINNNSLVLKIIYGKFSILLTGDIEKEAEESLSNYGKIAGVTVLKSPHHGSSTSSVEPFLTQTRPLIIIISSAWNPYRKLPSKTVLDRYGSLPWKPLVLNTHSHGNIYLSTNGVWLTISTDKYPGKNLLQNKPQPFMVSLP